jgi:hypothetical protein
MRRVLFLTAPMLVYASIGNSACAFIGLKFAKVISGCKENICVDFVQDMVSGSFSPSQFAGPNTQPVSCQKAINASKEFTRRVADNIDHTLSYDKLIADLEHLIYPALNDFVMSHGLHKLNQETLEAMGRVTRSMDQLPFFGDRRVSVFSNAPIVHELKKLTDLSFRQLLSQSHFLDTFTGSNASVIHFLFDLIAWIRCYSSIPGLEAFQIILGLHAPGYRPIHPFEFRHEYSRFSPYDIVNVSTQIRMLVELQSPRLLKVNAFNHLRRFLSYKRAVVDRAASEDAMIMHEIETDLCPVLDRAAEKVDGSRNLLWRKSVLTLIEMCKGSGTASLEVLINASIGLDYKRRGDARRLPYSADQVHMVASRLGRADENVHDWLTFRFHPDLISDPLGFSIAVLLQFIQTAGLEEYFVPDVALSNIDEPMKALGRAFGLVIREDGGFAWILGGSGIGIPPLILRGIFEVELHPSDAREIVKYSRHIFHIRAGLTTVLGPAGFTLFSRSLGL